LFQNTLGEREKEVWLELAISAMFSSLKIKGNEEVDLTIGVMDPAGAGALTDLSFPCSSVDFFFCSDEKLNMAINLLW
jgi:hypothetical protein